MNETDEMLAAAVVFMCRIKQSLSVSGDHTQSVCHDLLTERCEVGEVPLFDM